MRVEGLGFRVYQVCDENAELAGGDVRPRILVPHVFLAAVHAVGVELVGHVRATVGLLRHPVVLFLVGEILVGEDGPAIEDLGFGGLGFRV